MIFVGLCVAAAGCRAIYGLDDPQPFEAGIGGDGVLVMHALNGTALFNDGQADGVAWANCQTTESLRNSRVGNYDGTGPNVATLTSLGIDTNGSFSVWLEGSVLAYDSPMSIELVADEFAFVDLSFDHGVTWMRELTASPGMPDIKTLQFPESNTFYSVRIGWSNLSGQEVFLFNRKGASESAYGDWTQDQLKFP
ncbi:MAG: hypothetical protein QM831_17345 [Kofleriaceae bacterium]